MSLISHTILANQINTSVYPTVSVWFGFVTLAGWIPVMSVRDNKWSVEWKETMWAVSCVSCGQRWSNSTAQITLTASGRTWRGRGSVLWGSNPKSPGSCSWTAASAGKSSPSSCSTLPSSSTASTLYVSNRPHFHTWPYVPSGVQRLSVWTQIRRSWFKCTIFHSQNSHVKLIYLQDIQIVIGHTRWRITLASFNVFK